MAHYYEKIMVETVITDASGKKPKDKIIYVETYECSCDICTSQD